MESSKRVAFNTIILYTRMIIMMGISIYSTRLVLNGLGIRDYGIFNLLAGIIAMLSFLNAAMSTSTQRFLSFYQGKNELSMQKKVFSNSLVLHIAIAITIVIALELIGLFLFNDFLKIPAERIGAAKSIFHFMAATVFFTVVEVPFTGTLNAHEDILWLAMVSILEAILKFGVAISLAYSISGHDKLIFYGICNPLISVVSTILYASFCLIRYKECTLRIWNRIEVTLMKKLASFAGWNLFGTLCGLGRSQGIAVILNIFLGTVVNAAYGIANQINGQLSFFSVAIIQSINPQIMKSEGSGDRHRMLRLSMMASKFGFFFLSMISIPCIFEMSRILALWLKNVPPSTVIFCNLILISTLVNQLTIGLQSAVQAIGNIKKYQTIVGSIILLNIPISFVILKMRLPSYYVFISFSIIELIACTFRMYFLKKLAGLSINEYIRRVFLKEIIPVVLMIATCSAVIYSFDFKFRFLLTGIASTAIFAASTYLFGLEADEKQLIHNMLGKFIKKKPQVVL